MYAHHNVTGTLGDVVEDHVVLLMQAFVFLVFIASRSMACLTTVMDLDDSDAVDDACGVYAESRLAVGSMTVLLVFVKVVMMETGIADLNTLMRFDLPMSLRLGLAFLLLAGLSGCVRQGQSSRRASPH